MSAVACIYTQDGPVNEAEALEMMNGLASYRHDYSRTWMGKGLFFACIGQFFTPEAEHERLPFQDGETGLVINADAILDNRDDLIARLQAGGKQDVLTDAELILLAYRKWGARAPEYMIGDFTFLIWDYKERRLFGARDRMGGRSLYYREEPGHTAFCTTIAPLLSFQRTDKRPDEQWLAEFMAIPEMYESTDIFSTVYRNVRQIPPAHTFTLQDGRLTVMPYRAWEPVKELRLRSDEEYEEAFREVFRKAVDSKIRCRQHVGATLSGGLDSGSVASFAAKALKQNGKSLHTFSYIPERDFVDWTPRGTVANESPYIQSTVNYVGNINGHYLDFAGKSSYDEIDDWLSILETPYKFFENSFWLKGIYETAEQKKVGALLMGSRGNFSISWGPAVPYFATLVRKLKWLQCYREARQYSRNRGMAGKLLMTRIAKEAFPFLQGSSAQPANMPMLLINPEFANRTNVFATLRAQRVGLRDPLIRQASELRRDKLQSMALGNKNGASATKLSLRYGVLERDPTADPRVIEFCLSLPFGQYVKDGMDRALIRRSTLGYLPDNIRLNQRIRGIQAADWVHRMTASWPAFIRELNEICDDPVAGEYLNVQHIKAAISAYGAAPKPEYAFLPEVRVLMRGLIIYRFLKKACS
ncbi:asparagine synthetase B [Paenibacillus sp. N4]|uniref:asparagine synthase-related protein n=1 Tax=Paenibacillus vietnamensis TaxID=2590547 RepID=UPI001CD09A20|nr:asparagine synthase-related protein [Paenibacillus vietnamensis]MCA0755698.1 asparagine synthetase B [Paenibacillus vietnamensis]